MVCSYRSYFIKLLVVLIYFQVKGYPLRFNHVCQGEYVVLNDIDFDRAERNICRDCVDELRGGGKYYTLKKVGDRNMYRADKSKEDEEEA